MYRAPQDRAALSGANLDLRPEDDLKLVGKCPRTEPGDTYLACQSPTLSAASPHVSGSKYMECPVDVSGGERSRYAFFYSSTLVLYLGSGAEVRSS